MSDRNSSFISAISLVIERGSEEQQVQHLRIDRSKESVIVSSLGSLHLVRAQAIVFDAWVRRDIVAGEMGSAALKD